MTFNQCKQTTNYIQFVNNQWAQIICKKQTDFRLMSTKESVASVCKYC